MNNLTVVLMCHNRTKSAVEAINSILNQDIKDFDFLISDNSTNNKLQELLNKDFPKIETIFCNPHHKTLFDHFNSLISKIKTKYIVLFHDDDVMQNSYVKRVLETFQDFPEASAIATNGDFFEGGRVNKIILGGSQFKCEGENLVFKDKKSLLERYLAWDSGGVAPFTSYAYNMSKINDLRADFNRGRHYCDAFFVIDALDKGEIVWINEPLVSIRQHNEQISEGCGVRDYKSTITTIKKEFKGEVSNYYIDEYRFRNLFYRSRKKDHLPFPVIKFFLKMAPLLFFRSKAFRKRVFAVFWKR